MYRPRPVWYINIGRKVICFFDSFLRCLYSTTSGHFSFSIYTSYIRNCAVINNTKFKMVERQEIVIAMTKFTYK